MNHVENFKRVMAVGLLVATSALTQAALGEETVERKTSESRSSSEQRGAKRSKNAANRKKTTVTTTTTTSTNKAEDPNSVDYRVQAEKTKASAKVDAADAKVEAAETRANAKIEATETKAKAQIEATETRSQADIEATEKRAAAETESAHIRADNRGSGSSSTTSGIFERSGRVDHRFGAYVSMWGDPFPAPIGINIGYNVTDYLRTTLGVGSNDDRTFSLSTFGFGVKGVVPKWALTPVVGLNVSTTTGPSTGVKSIRGFNPNGSRVYGTAGIEWQSGLGLNFGAGYAHSFRTAENGTLYFNLGMFL